MEARCPKCGALIDTFYGKCTLCGGIDKKPDTPRQELTLDTVVEMVRRGNASATIEGINPPIVLQSSEELILALPQFTLVEPRAVRETSGAYGGPFFKVAKGVSLRFGGVKATSYSHDELTPIDTGIFTLTSRRLVFTGSKRNVNMGLAK